MCIDDTNGSITPLAGIARDRDPHDAKDVGHVNDEDPLRARFNNPTSIDIDDEDNIYVIDQDGAAIRIIQHDGIKSHTQAPQLMTIMVCCNRKSAHSDRRSVNPVHDCINHEWGHNEIR